ncbi:MAG: DUF3800 domain-containing protein [Bosea sp.]|uniref:DUF3800 domain-containing protein n=1 Tax=Bosea sp. (in: a-proteobacteria) TaxID=1871050 RepID=UPI001AC70454|nr:DUF3800 domain-containing protein [Bosea sp. (in: a-proteobacteria)]MBN9470663.1 DUF3800 domain-containing protein [Bosea sp. (in: a-proteobacteria)]
MLIFIDESGDAGFKLAKGSSPHFVAALVAFRDPEQAVRTGTAIEDLAKRLKLRQEFKFSKSRNEVRDEFFRTVAPFDFCVRAIVVKKELIYSANLRSDKERFYSFFVKSMLAYDGGLLSNARVVIDGSGERAFRNELAVYLRRHTGPGAIRKVSFSDSARDRMVQLADMCAGAIARGERRDKEDPGRWRGMLAPRIENIWHFR